jgi:hypothetical protein
VHFCIEMTLVIDGVGRVIIVRPLLGSGANFLGLVLAAFRFDARTAHEVGSGRVIC